MSYPALISLQASFTCNLVPLAMGQTQMGHPLVDVIWSL